MKPLAILAIFAVLAYVSANVLPPVYEGPTYELTAIDEPAYDDEFSNLAHHKEVSNLTPIRRNRRMSCDLKFFSSNNSACAAKCLQQGRKGGRCSSGVCVCRS